MKKLSLEPKKTLALATQSEIWGSDPTNLHIMCNTSIVRYKRPVINQPSSESLIVDVDLEPEEKANFAWFDMVW